MQERTETSPGASSRRGWKSLLSLGLAALACPCHLPLVLGLFAGTTLGLWMSQHTFVVMLVMLGVFAASLLYGVRGFNRQRITEEAVDSEAAASAIPTREKETPTVGRVQTP